MTNARLPSIPRLALAPCLLVLLLAAAPSCRVELDLPNPGSGALIEKIPARYRQILEASQSIEIEAEALLAGGRYILDADDDLWVRVKDSTVVTLRASVSVAMDDGHARLHVSQAVVELSEPVIGNRKFRNFPRGGVQGKVDRVELTPDDRVSVRAMLAESLARTVASVVVPMDGGGSSPPKDILQSLVVRQLDYRLRPGATLELEGSTLALASDADSGLHVRDASWDRKSGRVEGRGRIELHLGEGTRIRRDDTQIEVGSMAFASALLVELQPSGALSLQLDREAGAPTTFELLAGRIEAGAGKGDLRIDRLDGAIEQFILDDSGIVLDVTASAELGRSLTNSSMGPMVIEGGSLQGVDVSYSSRPGVDASSTSTLSVEAQRLTIDHAIALATTDDNPLLDANADELDEMGLTVSQLGRLLERSTSGPMIAPGLGIGPQLGMTTCSRYAGIAQVPEDRCEAVCGGEPSFATGADPSRARELVLSLLAHPAFPVGGAIACEAFENAPVSFGWNRTQCRAACKDDVTAFEVVAARSDDPQAPQIVRGNLDPGPDDDIADMSIGFTRPTMWLYLQGLTIEHLHAQSLRELTAASATLHNESIQMGWDDGTGRRVFAKAPARSELFISAGSMFRLGASSPSEVQPHLVARGRWPEIEIRDGSHVIRARDTEVDFEATSLVPLRGRVELGVVEAGLQGTRLDGASFSLRSLQLALGDTSSMAASAEIRLPTPFVLEQLDGVMPTSLASAPSRITNDLQKIALGTVMGIAKPTDIGRLKEWHVIAEATGLDTLGLSVRDGQLRLAGQVMGVVRLMANKQHIKCRAYPPKCSSWHSVVEVSRLSIRVDVDVSVALSTNAPATLANLKLIAKPTINGVNVNGLQNDLERLLLSSTLEQLGTKSFEIPVGRLVESALGGVDPSRVLVREASFRLDPEQLVLDFDIDYQ